MKKLEKREVMITCCDYCSKEMTPPYSSIEFKSGLKVDLCSSFISKDIKTCKDKYLEENRFKP